MTTLEQLTEQALKLPASSRAMLSQALVESLAAPDAAELHRQWADEALQRRRDGEHALRAGRNEGGLPQK